MGGVASSLKVVKHAVALLQSVGEALMNLQSETWATDRQRAQFVEACLHAEKYMKALEKLIEEIQPQTEHEINTAVRNMYST